MLQESKPRQNQLKIEPGQNQIENELRTNLVENLKKIDPTIDSDELAKTPLKIIQLLAEKINENQKLKKDLIHDLLTNLKTREYFLDESEKIINKSVKPTSERRQKFESNRFSFLFCDIDHFKQINDRYGHAVGDEILKAVAATLEKNIRIKKGDIACRYGGEEIVVSLLNSSEENSYRKAIELNERVKEKINSLFVGKYPELKISLSIGVAEFEPGLTPEELLNRADQAMYQAKKNGRDQVINFSQLK
ncbi:MAG: GGDEF domain-containing protein [Patescibacteria group bacterium]|nr:GGDEF domain-containing protein [Patescibacteria group bacterium]MCL5257779.1 GGDEF domain-containing protein [Patescibacteria group bacterium]